jgi:hypothetical protein
MHREGARSNIRCEKSGYFFGFLAAPSVILNARRMKCNPRATFDVNNAENDAARRRRWAADDAIKGSISAPTDWGSGCPRNR